MRVKASDAMRKYGCEREVGIVDDYIHNRLSVQELSEKYGIPEELMRAYVLEVFEIRIRPEFLSEVTGDKLLASMELNILACIVRTPGLAIHLVGLNWYDPIYKKIAYTATVSGSEAAKLEVRGMLGTGFVKGLEVVNARRTDEETAEDFFYLLSEHRRMRGKENPANNN